MEVGRIAPARLRRAARAGAVQIACLGLALSAHGAGAAEPTSQPEAPAAAVGDPDRLDELGDAIEPVRTQQGIQFRWSADQRFTFGADFDGADADEQRYGMAFRVTRRTSPKLAIRVSATWKASLFDFDGPTDLITGTPQPGDPFDTLYRSELVAAALYRLSDHWSLAGGGFGRSSLESGADFGDSLVGGGFFAVGYEFGSRLEMGAGVRVRSRLRDNGVKVSPIYRLRWKVTDTVRLETSGLGLRIRYRPSQALQLSVSGRFESDRYRLDDAGTPLGEGTLQVRQVPVAAGVVWRPMRSLRLGLDVGAMVHQKLRARDEDNDTGNSISAGPAPFVGTRIEIRF